MKNEIRLALLCLAASAAVPALAQGISQPRCGASNFDKALGVYTVRKPAVDAVNQQCFVTVYATGAKPSAAAKSPQSYFVEGNYALEVSGGGGGGGGGGSGNKGGGGAGGGAVAMKTVQYLS